MYADDIVLCPLVLQACRLSLTYYKHFVILLILIKRQWLFFNIAGRFINIIHKHIIVKTISCTTTDKYLCISFSASPYSC